MPRTAVQTVWFVKLVWEPQWQSTWAQRGDVNSTSKNPDFSKCVLSGKKQSCRRFCSKKTRNTSKGGGLSSCLQPQGSWLCWVWWKISARCTEAIILFLYFRWGEKQWNYLRYSGPQAARNVCFDSIQVETKQEKRQEYRSWIKRKNHYMILLVEREKLWVKTAFLKVAGAVITYCETWCEYNSIMSLFLFLRTAAPFPFFFSRSPSFTSSIFLDHQLAKY